MGWAYSSAHLWLNRHIIFTLAVWFTYYILWQTASKVEILIMLLCNSWFTKFYFTMKTFQNCSSAVEHWIMWALSALDSCCDYCYSRYVRRVEYHYIHFYLGFGNTAVVMRPGYLIVLQVLQSSLQLGFQTKGLQLFRQVRNQLFSFFKSLIDFSSKI